MVRKRKSKQPEYSLINIVIDNYDVVTHAGINLFLNSNLRDMVNEDDPAYTFESSLLLQGTCIEPKDREGHWFEVTLYGSSNPPRHLRHKIKHMHKHDEDGNPIYKKYRKGSYPVYQEPSGLCILDKVRGENSWRIWLQVAPQMVTDSLLLLSSGKQAYLSVQEMKENR
ncbi:MAG: hypothetical protein AB2669_00515 [Candidatus Thiodiazotropha endolucinida]